MTKFEPRGLKIEKGVISPITDWNDLPYTDRSLDDQTTKKYVKEARDGDRDKGEDL